MNPTLSPATTFLLRPSAAFAEIVAGFRDAVRTFRHIEEVDPGPATPEEALTGLSEHVLRDIGAPATLIARAVARRQSTFGDELLWPSYSRID